MVVIAASRACYSFASSTPPARFPAAWHKVRTSALNIILHVFSVDDPGVTAFLALEENHGRFFIELSRLMQDAYSQVLCRVRRQRRRQPEVTK